MKSKCFRDILVFNILALLILGWAISRHVTW